MAGYVTSVPKDAKNFICHLAKFTATDCSRSTTQMSSRSIPRKTHADFGKQSDKHLAIYWPIAANTLLVATWRSVKTFSRLLTQLLIRPSDSCRLIIITLSLNEALHRDSSATLGSLATGLRPELRSGQNAAVKA